MYKENLTAVWNKLYCLHTADYYKNYEQNLDAIIYCLNPKKSTLLPMEVKENFNKNEISSSLKFEKYINRIIIKEGFVSFNVNVKEISTDGGNYVGQLYEVDVKGKTIDGDKEINVFVKNIQLGEIEFEMLSIPGVYKTELFAYQELSHLFNELQDEACVPLNERYIMVKCYDESDKEVILLDNLAKKGFRTNYRMDIVPLKFAEMAIEKLAKFHALSFVIQEKRPEYFVEKIKAIDIPFYFGKVWDGFSTNLRNYAMEIIDADVRSKVEKSLYGILNKYPKYHQDSSRKYCLCHGDYRPNNVMMKEIGGEISEVIPVDYQMIHYGCPVFDLLYFIYTSMDREFRNKHLENLKELYYASMKKFLLYFNMDVEIVFPRKVYEKTYNECLDYGLMIFIILGPFIFVNDDILDITKDSLSNFSINLDDKFKDRLQEIIEEFIEKGYL